MSLDPAFDFSPFNINSNPSKNFDSFWERDSVKDANNSFFSNDSNKGQQPAKEPSPSQSKVASKINSKQASQVNQISIGAFGDPQQPSQMKSSGISKRFNIQKQSQEEVMEAAGNLSRTLSDIDVNDFNTNNSRYYYSKEMPLGNAGNTDDNYEALKKYLSEPKKMDFDKFFGELDQKDTPNSSFLKRKQYSNLGQFQEYIRKTKEDKRNQQLMREREIRQQKEEKFNRRDSKEIAIPKVLEINHFKKKPSSSHILDDDLVRFNNDDAIENSNPTSVQHITFKSTQNINKQKPGSKDNWFGDQEDFFADDNQNVSIKSQKSKDLAITKSKLPMIVDADENIYETTDEEIRLTNLFGNFQKMMENYNLLRGELQSNTKEHQKLMKELNVLKDDYSKKQQEYEKSTPRSNPDDKAEKEKLLKPEGNEKMNQIQFDIYKKIENLETVMKETFDKENDEKNNLVWVNPDFIPGSDKEVNQNPNRSSERLVEGASKEEESPSRQNHTGEIMSPLDLRLNINSEDFNVHSRVSQSRSVAFSPPPKKNYTGESYQPKHLSVDLHYKNTCLQDSNSIIFQSFDFVISAKYTFVRTGRKHLKISIKIKNKTILVLNDFMVIMYGSVGEVLQISPSKMFLERFGPQESKSLEAIVDSFRIGGEPIRMQVSYRTQRDRKGKVSVSVPRPIVKFMDIRFTHQDQFNEIWASTKNQLYLQPRNLNFQIIKSTEDIKLIFPFIQIGEADEREFSYGLIFSILNVEGMLLLKLVCNVEGTATVHIKFQEDGLRGYAREVLDTLNLIMFS